VDFQVVLMDFQAVLIHVLDVTLDTLLEKRTFDRRIRPGVSNTRPDSSFYAALALILF
jgi:hypothetical protein